MKHSLSTALLTDMYELTMIESAFETGRAELPCVFEVFGRRLPGSRRYGVVAGTGRILEALQDFTFDDDEIAYLRDAHVVGERTLEFLKNWRFTGDIYGYAEGECYFPYSPLLTVVGTFAECVVLETLVLSILNYDSAVATAASRVTIAAHDRPCLEMGARRTHEYSAVAAARAAIIGGFVGTSDLEAGRRYGISTIGTAAHSFTLLHGSEDEAFAAQIRTLGPNTTLLVDTYNIHDGVEKAVAAARAAGGELGAVRIDSGDLVAQAFQVRAQLDELGATTTKITVTSDLDEYAIAALNAAPVDSYGVGTKLVTGSGHPTAQLVYKLVARKDEETDTWVGVSKRSESKTSRGGLKVAGRKYDVTGRATAELIVTVDDFEDGIAYLKEQGARPLQVILVSGGEIQDEYMNATAFGRAAERHRSSRAALPYNAWRLSEGEPGIPTEFVDIR
ncbi:nicotinate phosphoribosyltransferase [Arcanobacterium phocae]|uniref:nicotinate phosphoribosyltransferase n=1 Tax=Arcanobacterium phocae TaxID=131112 RepID=UPI001C0EDDB5|nr:nicotinate phosphoribosyltransferase [Arcanobacterium phocae]